MGVSSSPNFISLFAVASHPPQTQLGSLQKTCRSCWALSKICLLRSFIKLERSRRSHCPRRRCCWRPYSSPPPLFVDDGFEFISHRRWGIPKHHRFPRLILWPRSEPSSRTSFTMCAYSVSRGARFLLKNSIFFNEIPATNEISEKPWSPLRVADVYGIIIHGSSCFYIILFSTK